MLKGRSGWGLNWFLGLKGLIPNCWIAGVDEAKVQHNCCKHSGGSHQTANGLAPCLLCPVHYKHQLQEKKHDLPTVPFICQKMVAPFDLDIFISPEYGDTCALLLRRTNFSTIAYLSVVSEDPLRLKRLTM